MATGPAESQFQMLVSSVEDYAIFMIDPGGHIATWNAGAERIKGYAPDEAIGKHISIFYAPEDRAAERPQRLLAIAARDGRVEDEGWRVRKDGTRFWADVVITAMRDERGTLQGFAKVTRDLTLRKAGEDALRLSQERLAATLHSIGDAVLATDEHGAITEINPVAERLTGWRPAEAIGRPIDEVFVIVNEDTRQPAVNPVGRVLADGIVVGLANHTALIARDGTERPIADSGAPIRDGSGVVRGVVLVFRDVTEERRAENALRQSEERLRLMIDSVQDYAIYMLDPQGRVTSWNPGAERIKGYRAEEIIGRHFSGFFTEEDLAEGKPEAELARAAAEGRLEIEAWRVRKDGTRFWANVVVSAVRDAAGALIGFTKVSRDLTDRRRAEDERLRLAQAQEAVRLRDEFLSIASHELKTPLAALHLQLQSLQTKVAAADEKLGARVTRAIRAGDRLADLIEALLDVSRLAAGTLELKFEPVDLVEITRDVVERVRDAAVSARCDLTLAGAPAVVARVDRLRLEQIVTNLLSNAIKYAAGKPIEVTVGTEARTAIVEVRDHGPGLDQADLQRIFGRFERASSANYGGLGLGLYIALQLAEAHGGTVVASNPEDGGARFELRLPLL